MLKLGFDEKKLFLTVVDEKFKCRSHEVVEGEYICSHHMVLSYFKTKNKAPLILDNLSFRVLNLKQRKDLTADTFTNSTGIYRMDKKYKLNKVANYAEEFENLLKKIKIEQQLTSRSHNENDIHNNIFSYNFIKL